LNVQQYYTALAPVNYFTWQDWVSRQYQLIYIFGFRAAKDCNFLVQVFYL
jgi:hypothetical protein